MSNPQKPNDGGPAFPFCDRDGYGVFAWQDGMSLLDYFAGQAMVGYLAAGRPQVDTAAQCYEYAREMLEEREKIQKENDK